MIAILPLLFANGHPVALPNFTAAELEKFISFMVTCSWGHDTASAILQPPWWPKDVPFSHPFARPTSVPKNWEEKLKQVVRKCYEFHKSTFLLVFSAQLARHPRHKLRYVDNRDHTTSLYDKPNGKLLVTFRNENLYYDAKSILLDDDDEETRAKTIDDDETDDEAVKPSLVGEEPQIKSDIYLCDNCDSHFDNLEILKAHEKLCNNEDVPSSSCTGGLPDFLSALKLLPVGANVSESECGSSSESKSKFGRSAANIDRGPPYPFSSLAYTRSIKTNVQRDTTYSRERVERYCCTNPLPSKVLVKGKNQFPVRYRRPIDYWHRKHTFPNQRKKKILDVNGQLLMLKCRPIAVHIDRMSSESMEEYIENLKKEAERKALLMVDKDIVFVDGLDCDQTDFDLKNLDPLKRADNECEVIDLCSDDETPSVNENCDPRAGITCVMRGGAVLRRTAATPQVLPSEPCGARQRPLAAAILQPHPVILIAHTLNHLQTISLE